MENPKVKGEEKEVKMKNKGLGKKKKNYPVVYKYLSTNY